MNKICWTLLLSIPLFLRGQTANLSGKADLDSGWDRKFCVSRIPAPDQLFTVSGSLIIARGDLDTAGHFSLDLPAIHGETLYRLHFVRKHDPASTLIIGSEHVNHVFFIAGAHDSIIFDRAKGTPISQSRVIGGKATAMLNGLLALAASDTAGNESFLSLAERSASPLVKLMAIDHIYKPSDEQKEQIRNLLASFDVNDPYGARIIQEYRHTSYRNIYMLLIFPVLILLSFYGYKIYKKEILRKRWCSLSQRERDIVALILSGRSNKEVGVSLSIGISTVKTHLNNIYGKLNINDRKDLERFRPFIPAFTP